MDDISEVLFEDFGAKSLVVWGVLFIFADRRNQ
jgi:hypothetical protein